MPGTTQTRMVSPVVLAETRRVRLLRRAAALLAFAAFIAGILVAVGYPEVVLLFAPFAAAGVVCATALWGLWRARRWRVVRVAAHGVDSASRVRVRTVRRVAATVPPASLAAAEWVSRPREPWRPPAAVDRT